MSDQNMMTDDKLLQQTIKQLLNAWDVTNKAVTDILNENDDAFYQLEVSPGKNRAIYLLGHLVAINDGMLELLDNQPRVYPELEQLFVGSPDRAHEKLPSVQELRQMSDTINAKLNEILSATPIRGWFDRHSKVSPADFELTPTRNKLSILISRTNHSRYHLGQLILLKKKI